MKAKLKMAAVGLAVSYPVIHGLIDRVAHFFGICLGG